MICDDDNKEFNILLRRKDIRKIKNLLSENLERGSKNVYELEEMLSLYKKFDNCSKLGYNYGSEIVVEEQGDKDKFYTDSDINYLICTIDYFGDFDTEITRTNIRNLLRNQLFNYGDFKIWKK